MAIFRCFLKDNISTTSPDDARDLRNIFIDYFKVCFECLQKHVQFKDQRELHNSMVEGYNKFAVELSQEVGYNIPLANHV
jgi:hypothetical protein